MPASTHILLSGNDVNRWMDAGFRPGSRGPFVSAKGPKTIDAPSGIIEEEGRHPLEERTNSLCSNKVR